MLKEFKDFISKGNVMDMAIGVVVGGAFQKIVNSLVNDVIMPFTSIFTGKIDFSSLTLSFGNVSIRYGSFITEIINFLILAFSVFIAIRTIIKLNKKLETVASDTIDKKGKRKKKEETEVPSEKICPYCFSKIDIRATKCPHCVSDLTQKEEITD